MNANDSYYIYLAKTALRRAGFFNKNTDNKITKDYETALRAFQRANGITETGTADKETKEFLKPYLYGYTIHTVKEGDSFFRLARLYNTTINLISTANPDAVPTNLKLGERLIIPFNFDVVPTDIPYSSELLKYIVNGLKARYPFLTVGSIGQSVMKSPLYYLRVGKGEKEVFYNASHHANEWITTPLLLYFLETYIIAYLNGENLKGVSAEKLYNTVSLYIVPMVDPDGVDLVTGYLNEGSFYDGAKKIWENYPSIPFPDGWKANIEGTDINLNYPAYWEEAKKIKYGLGFTSPAPRNYVGTEPLSAPESKAVYDFTVAHDFKLTLSYHTQGQTIYWKFLDYNPEGSYEIALEFQKESGYMIEETPMESGYAGYKDWFIMTYNLPGYTIEAGLGSNPLPLYQLPDIYKRNLGILVKGMELA